MSLVVILDQIFCDLFCELVNIVVRLLDQFFSCEGIGQLRRENKRITALNIFALGVSQDFAPLAPNSSALAAIRERAFETDVSRLSRSSGFDPFRAFSMRDNASPIRMLFAD